jgi:hypothetical protein
MDRQRISVSLPTDLIERVDQMAKRVELTRNGLLLTLIQEGIDALERSGEGQLLKLVLLKKGLRERQQERMRLNFEIVSENRT